MKASARAVAQKERILAAAEQCFFEHGFHAASMGTIAQTADMSPGLIYRYFASKNAIIQAIIDRQLGEARDNIRRLSSSEDVVAAIVTIFGQWKTLNARTMNAALFLEMTAEATRDKDIAAAVRAADTSIRTELHEFLKHRLRTGRASGTRTTAKSRLILLQSLIEGLAVRAIREPDLDDDTVRRALEKFVPLLVA
ncbi:MAG: TetR/AcrR family transcriptional regulator [Steroidobacteraceae bacterium]